MTTEGTAQTYWKQAVEQALMGVTEQAERLRELALSTDHASTLQPWQRQLLDGVLELRHGRDRSGRERVRLAAAHPDGLHALSTIALHLERSRLPEQGRAALRSALSDQKQSGTGPRGGAVGQKRLVVAAAAGLALAAMAWFGVEAYRSARQRTAELERAQAEALARAESEKESVKFDLAYANSNIGLLVTEGVYKIEAPDSPAKEIAYPLGRGTFFAISTEGHCLTNRHVIDPAMTQPGFKLFEPVTGRTDSGTEFTVTCIDIRFRGRFGDGEWLDVEKVQAFDDHDMALVRVAPRHKRVFDRPLVVGPPPSYTDSVTAWGFPGVSKTIADGLNPVDQEHAERKKLYELRTSGRYNLQDEYPLEKTVINATPGNVSALYESTEPGSKGDYIQITAFVWHGNSGGPLVDAQGRAIGLVTRRGVVAERVDGKIVSRDFQNVNGAFVLQDLMTVLFKKQPSLRDKITLVGAPQAPAGNARPKAPGGGPPAK